MTVFNRARYTLTSISCRPMHTVPVLASNTIYLTASHWLGFALSDATAIWPRKGLKKICQHRIHIDKITSRTALRWLSIYMLRKERWIVETQMKTISSRAIDGRSKICQASTSISGFEHLDTDERLLCESSLIGCWGDWCPLWFTLEVPYSED